MRDTLLTFTTVVLLLAGCQNPQNPDAAATDGKNQQPSGRELLENMHKKWSDKWCPNMQFEQRVVHYENGEETRREVWQELISAPGKLHIRFDGFDTGNGLLFRNDSVYRFREGNVEQAMPFVHELLLSTYDFFFLPRDEAITRIERLGVDLDRSIYVPMLSLFEGPLYVVGSESTIDHENPQIWIDATHHYPRRVKYRRGEDVYDVYLLEYRSFGGCPTPTEIHFFLNRELIMEEYYADIVFPGKVDDALFRPKRFSDWTAFN